MKTLAQAAQSYRQQLQQIKKHEQLIQKTRADLKQLQDAAVKKTHELNKLKQLIDYCVITGESPAEAILKNTPEQIQQHIFNQPQNYTDSYGIVSGNSMNLGPITISNTITHINSTDYIHDAQSQVPLGPGWIAAIDQNN